MSTKVRILQLNCQKRIEGTQFLSRKTSNIDLFICGLQEPSIKNNASRGLDKQHKIFFSQAEKCRTMLYCHKNIPLWYLPRYSDRDICSGLWESPEHGKIIVSSVYWDSRIDHLPHKYLEVLDYCKARGIKHLSLMDSNAHHEMYGSADTNSRGLKIEDLVDEYNIDILNQGQETTWENKAQKKKEFQEHKLESV